MRSVDRGLALALGAWASAVFLLLWVGVIAAVAGNAALLSALWEGLNGLDGALLVGAWILFLPIAIGLWAANAGLALPVAGLIVIGLVAWTVAAWGGLARTLMNRHT